MRDKQNSTKSWKRVSEMTQRMQLQTSCWQRKCQNRCSRMFSAVDAGIIDSSEMEFIFCNHTFCLPFNARKSPLKSRFICICMSIEHDDPCETLLRTRIDRKKNEWVHPIRRIPSEWAILFKLRQTDRTYVDVIVAMKWACKLCRCEPPMLGRDSVSAFAIFVLRLSTQFYR